MTSLFETLIEWPVIAMAIFTSLGDMETKPPCTGMVMAQLAPVQEGVPLQQWCCCGSCCNWAISCDAIPGCGSC